MGSSWPGPISKVVLVACIIDRVAAHPLPRTPRPRANLDTYSFVDFCADFGRSYANATAAEQQQRAALFQASLAEIRATRAKNAKDGRSWRAGIHPFMDWTREELLRLNGYRPPPDRDRGGGSVTFLSSRKHGLYGRSPAAGNASLPSSVKAKVAPSMRQQGNCGSCWAISAVEAVEAQLQRQGIGDGQRLSAQALIDCVKNPRHCGGSGGCDGATGELAYSFMRETGIPFEMDLPYKAHTQVCPWQSPGTPWPTSRRVRVAGWSQLPSNKALPLMQALAQQGPVVVAVDGDSWMMYESGIFDGCRRDATLGHAVLATGYGVEGGKKYWSIQNSWGQDWGEDGYIRLLRRDDDDNYCGMDKKPQVGVGCDGGPKQVKVCGMCGLLYDPIQPMGVRLEKKARDVVTAASLQRLLRRKLREQMPSDD